MSTVQTARLCNGFTQKHIADLLGLSVKSYSTKEKNITKFTLIELLVMIRLLNINPDDITKNITQH